MCAATAARSALVVGASIIAIAFVRVLIDGILDGNWRANWGVAVELTAILSAIWFVLVFAYTAFKLHANEPVERILTEEHSSKLKLPMTGFVAMEYYALILNRTYIVFISPEGLYGWKAEGAVDCSRALYFAPYEEMLKDPELMTDPEAVRELSKLKGGFFIARNEIAAVEPVYKQKWGMGPIPHSGRIKVRTVSGRSREFVLLGSVDPDAIQQNIMGETEIVATTPHPSVRCGYQKKFWVPLLAFWIVLAGYVGWSSRGTWTSGSWTDKLTTAAIIAFTVLLFFEFMVQKLTFTENEIQRTTRFGNVKTHPYSSVLSFSPATDAFLNIRFEDGSHLKIYTWIGNPHDIIAILQVKSPKNYVCWQASDRSNGPPVPPFSGQIAPLPGVLLINS